MTSQREPQERKTHPTSGGRQPQRAWRLIPLGGLLVAAGLLLVVAVLDSRRPAPDRETPPRPTGTVAPLASPPEVTLKIEPLRTATAGDNLVADSLAVLRAQLFQLCWVAYAPTNYDPEQGIVPPAESIRADLQTLRAAGFTGLVTYGADLPIHPLAREAGFQGLILGVWDPTSPDELGKAAATAHDDVVLGYVVGNEGLDGRYDYAALQTALAELRRQTGKPVSTTEQWEDYADARLLDMGDWLFPNVHPYWHGITDPPQAVAWTVERYQELARQTSKPVVFKEVGLPSGGDPVVSEAAQQTYYQLLAASPVAFVAFEAYDQPWKQWAPVEPHWGLFRPDRSPKPAAAVACRSR